MHIKFPKNDARYEWTAHVKGKMAQYGISEALMKRIIKFPKRREEGIVERTIAVMQPGGNGKRKHEIWVMYQMNSKLRVISTWRYPGMSAPGKAIYIPADVLVELELTQ